MYVPLWNAVADDATLFDFIESHPFGMLVSLQDGEPVATHLPFLVGKRGTAGGYLLGHVARQNPQWKELVGQRVLAIFHGPHAYVSPSWYADTLHNVPTWNYTAVHVFGTPVVVSEPERVKAFLAKLTAYYEVARPEPWTFDPQSPYIEKLLNGIVAFEMPVERMDGKFKLSQNRALSDRGRVMWELKESESEMDRQVAAWMERLSFDG